MNGIEKHRGWASTRTGQDVDLALEDRNGRIVAIEVKGNSMLRAVDSRELESLSEMVGVTLRGFR